MHGGCRNGMVLVPGLGPGASLEGTTCVSRESGSATPQWERVWFRGEGTPAGLGPPGVHVWDLERQTP